ncbi:MAG TPA: reverse transcriptase/maturase family protein [archaeon]|nr:reverse transcriptase/maturase family protein [archaeon]
MKTYNNLWSKITSFKNLVLAYNKARKAKPQTKETLEFSLNLEKNLLLIQEELLANTYTQSKYREFIVFDPKQRKIKYLPFKDRVVHHALVNVIEPIFDKRLISTTYACRKNKGTHKALKDIKKTISREFRFTGYCLKCDVKKYFPSIDKIILKQVIEKKIRCKNTKKLIFDIIDSDYSNFGEDKGIPIGNLTSQLFSNIYLNELDQYIKHKLKIKYYYRYVDDFIILEDSKKQLNYYKKNIKYYLKKRLKLEIPKQKINLFEIKTGVDFVGYKIYPEYVFLRKRNIKKFIKKLKILTYEKNFFKVKSSISSYLGYFKFANSYKILDQIWANNPYFLKIKRLL